MFKLTRAALANYLRTDRRFYASTPDALMKEAAFIAKRMDGKLPALFGKLPRQQYSVAPCLTTLRPSTPAAATSRLHPAASSPVTTG